MKQLQLYLSMYELLKDNQKKYQLSGLEEFLSAANPFKLYDEQNISTQFIIAFEQYFKGIDYNEENAYAFIVAFLNDFDNKSLVNAFLLSSPEVWIKTQQMYS
ncbi:MAG: hypothetical protein EOM50_09950 [Erysipelotrichia bacterium]|nr:hypothetical protein [Erysipelotrichia bacterium]NCC54934.1 hypothetical protein [Erysipelotrichia bacterium]